MFIYLSVCESWLVIWPHISMCRINKIQPLMLYIQKKCVTHKKMCHLQHFDFGITWFICLWKNVGKIENDDNSSNAHFSSTKISIANTR